LLRCLFSSEEKSYSFESDLVGTGEETVHFAKESVYVIWYLVLCIDLHKMTHEDRQEYKALLDNNANFMKRRASFMKPVNDSHLWPYW
jgi:hypothetical protein